MNLFELRTEIEEYGEWNWLKAYGLLLESKPCPKCCKDARFYSNRILYRFNNYKCRCEFSIGQGTIFYNRGLSVREVILLMYFLVHSFNSKDIERELRISSTTIAEYKKEYRKTLETISEMKPQWIGGDYHVVQIDEMYVGKRKYNRGRRKSKQNCC